MISYNDLYELLRKEKFSENLQVLPKSFIKEFSEYLQDKKQESSSDSVLFVDSVTKSKKQLENSFAIFKELILRRKRKLLNLVFIAAETGIMKRDYENMLDFEKAIFDSIVKSFEEGDKHMSKIIFEGEKQKEDLNKMVIFQEDVEQFVDMTGNLVGPFNSGQLANLDKQVSDLFVSSGKAKFVDE